MAIPQTLRGWTFVQNAGTPSEAIVGAGTQTAVPFERLQSQITGAEEKGPLKTLVATFNKFVDRVISATLGSRSIPFGAGGTVLLAVQFTAGKTLKVAHRLGTTNVNAMGWCRSGASGYGSYALSSDGASIIFTPNTSFVADVYITVGTSSPSFTPVTSVGPTPGGSAGGDLDGTYPDPGVAKIQGNPVTAGGVAKGQFLVGTATNQWGPVSLSGDATGSSGTPGLIHVVGLQGNGVNATAPTAGQVLTYSGIAWGPATPTANNVRPASDASTLLDYRFNEQAVPPGLINHGSYGTASAPIGPIPTTTTANFTQPASGSTVVASVSSTTNYAAGELIFVGGGGGYYYCTATGAGSITLKNLAITGSNAAPTTVINNGASVQAKVDLLNYGAATSVGNNGLYDFATSFYATDAGSISNYNIGGTGGGIGAFSGIRAVSAHVLVWLNTFTSGSAFSQLFGYSWGQAWSPNFATIGFNSSPAGSLGVWSFFLNNQSVTLSANTPTASIGNMALGQWTLLSATLDFTKTTNALQLYKNGEPVGAANLNASSGTLAFNSTGYWYVGNPNLTGGDTGDSTNGTVAMARFENTIRSAAYIKSMWETIYPAASAWPVP